VFTGWPEVVAVAIALAAHLALGVALRRGAAEAPAWRMWFLGGALWTMVCPLVALPHLDLFGIFRFVAWSLFVHLPLGLAAAAIATRRVRYLALGLPVVAVGIDAFWYEPSALVVRRYRIETDKLDAPLRIGVLSDLQTDRVGRYEAGAIHRLLAESPDLLLLPGDYVQVDGPERFRQGARLRELLREARPRYGGVAVRGNVEREGWREFFLGTSIRAFEDTTAVEAGPVDVVALSFRDGFTAEKVELPGDRYTIAVAHSPDFALGDVDADLLVAGHTHGGQVVIPFFGPPITLSRLPRALAAGGLHALDGGRWLVVSRGVGLERRNAPRLRFLCRPEIVVIDVVPR
jgi:uncharacterized protein